MTRLWYCCYRPMLTLVVVTVCLVATSRSTLAVSNFCLIGTCDITNPNYINIYWDNGNWNVDIAQTSADMTIARIDALTRSLINSAYFSALTQYSVVSVTYTPSLAVGGCGAPPATLGEAHSYLGAFATCVVTLNPQLNAPNTILNVLLPPQTAPSSGDGWCAGAGTNIGEHGEYGSPVEVTFLPTNKACNGDIGTLLATMSHEMVEATTDPNPPSPTGWKVIGDGEVADQCENISPREPFLYGKVQQYFSNSLNACTPSFSLTPPAISSSTVCGSGENMKFSVSGTLGPKPWDLNNFNTLYVQAAISGTHNWDAGNYEGFPPDVVSFGSIAWTPGTGGNPDSLTIWGFGPAYGSTISGNQTALVRPGDQITLSIFGTQNGQLQTVTFTAPSPTKVVNFSATPNYGQPYYVGDSADVSGEVADNGGCGIEGVPLQLSSSDGPTAVSPNSQASINGGLFTATYAPTLAGVRTMSVTSPVSGSTTINVTPYAAADSPGQGTVAGGQTVTLTGSGFSSAVGATTVSLEGVAASNVQVSNSGSLTFTTPAAPGNIAGVADVVVAVQGITGPPLDYNYIVPDKPYFTFSGNGCDQSSASLVLNVYGVSGSATNEPITLSASYAAFKDASGTFVNAIQANVGQLISYTGTGPFTATPSGQSSLATTASPPVPPPAIICHGFPLALPGGVVLQWSLGPYQPHGCAACFQGSDGAVWTGIDNGAGGDYVLLSDRESTTIAELYSVQSLPEAPLRTFVHDSPYVLVNSAGSSSRVNFLGPAVSISAKGQLLGTAASMTAAGAVSFRVSQRHPQGADYGIVHLEGTGAERYWVEQKYTPNESSRRGAITVQVSQTGVYALALIRAPVELIRAPIMVIRANPVLNDK